MSLLLILLGATPTASDLLYASNRDGEYDLYVRSAPDAEPRKLVDLAGDETWPRWSPDGALVLFAWERDGRSDLAIFDPLASGGQGDIKLVTEDGTSFEGAWSPDGKRVVYRSARDGNDELYVQSLKSGEATRLTFDPASDWGPDWSPDGKTIVYATASPDLEAIARIPAAGGERTILTRMEGEESCPRWSPSGELIAFNAHPDGPSNELFVMGAEGEEPRRLTFDSRVDRYASSFSPTWSRDGKELAYTVMTTDGLDLYSIEAEGGERRRLTSLPAAESRPDWRPRARTEEDEPAASSLECEERIVYATKQFGWNAEIASIPASGGEPRRLTRTDAHNRRPRISPDGRWVAFESHRDGNANLYLMRPDGTGVRQITESEADDMGPCWAPDGKRLAFSSDRAGSADLWTVDLESLQFERLTTQGGAEWRPAWSPAGDRIAFQSDRSGNEEVYLLELASGEERRLTDAPGRDGWPAWSPDGQQLLFFSERDGVSALYVWDAAKDRQTRITDLDASSFFGAWSPDGSEIVFSREFDEHNDWSLWCIRPDGSGLRRFHSSDARDFQAHWGCARQ